MLIFLGPLDLAMLLMDNVQNLLDILYFITLP